MAFYDTFSKIENPIWTKKALVYFNKNILEYLLTYTENKEVSILEIGPGKGYFYEAVKRSKNNIFYSAADRNKLILEKLKCNSVYLAEAPDLPIFDKQFDIIYASFLIEHLQNGIELFNFISNCKKILNKKGIIVFLAPDCLREKIEFWNIDYTHIYPTTKRNVSMAFRDNKIEELEIINFNGLITHKYFWIKSLNFLMELTLIPYSYKILNLLFYPLYGKRSYELDNIFYKGHCFLKEKNFMLIARP
jgi:SAM-dependent methyltransferase